MAPKKGGIRQQLGYDVKRDRETEPVDTMLKGMLKKGRLTAPEVQTASEKIVSILPQGASGSSGSSSSSGAPGLSGISEWAEVGTAGANHQNISRDITRRMAKDSAKASIFASPVPFWDHVRNGQFTDDMYFSVPHETLEAEIGDEADALEWARMPDDGRYKSRLDDWKCREGLLTITEHQSSKPIFNIQKRLLQTSQQPNATNTISFP